MDENKENVSKLSKIKRMTITGELNRFIIYITIAFFVVFFIILAILSTEPLGLIKPLKFGNVILGTNIDYLVLAVIISTGIFGIYNLLRERKVRKINERFPDFIRDLAESRRAGMTFTKAIIYSSKGNYSLLTPEIQKIAQQISWGNSVEKALDSFAKRVNTKLIKRTVTLINEASRSGGNVADVLDAASNDARELKYMESERRAGMLSYVAVVYVSMVVFLMVIVILCKSLIPAMLGSGHEGLSSVMGGSGSITQYDMTLAFFTANIIQSAGMGIVTGVFEDGKIIAGVKHIFIMVFLTWFIFKFFVGGI
ncbi:MAG: type II secretion system F family protein [Candidatus Thermoplasmatota archaeon]|nr:type II secretion system F family protein [Candidatus Thermoplasmatota archaeon]